MNFKNILISAATIVVLIATAFVVYYDYRVNRSLIPSWNSPIELGDYYREQLKLDSIYELEPGQSYFRLWIFPSFNHQSVIDVNIKGNIGSISTTYFQYPLEGEELEIIKTYQRTLSKDEIYHFRNQLVDSQFIHIRPGPSEQVGVDGTSWSLEVNINNSYLSQSGWGIEDKPFVILRDAIISLTDKSLRCLQIDCKSRL